MSNPLLTLLAQVGLFPLGKVKTPITPAVNGTTFTVESLDDLAPINNSSLTTNNQGLFDGLYYGGVETPTTRQLSYQISRMEKGKFSVLTPSGQSAIHILLTTLTRPGDHLLVSDTITYTTRWLIDQYFQARSIEVEYFQPAEATMVATKLQPNTKLVFWESPGAFTFEIIDHHAIVESCRNHPAITIMDNTWAASTFHHPLETGVDISLISMSKLHCAVEGVSLGAIVTNNKKLYSDIKVISALLGSHVGSEPCASALRSMSTLGARLSFQMDITSRLLGVLNDLGTVKQILHPSLAVDNSDFFKKNYTGFNSLVTIEFACSSDELAHRLNRLKIIKFGYGWGGTLSLVSLIDVSSLPSPARMDLCGPCARFYFGLEDVIELERDLRNALA